MLQWQGVSCFRQHRRCSTPFAVSRQHEQCYIQSNLTVAPLKTPQVQSHTPYKACKTGNLQQASKRGRSIFSLVGMAQSNVNSTKLWPGNSVEKCSEHQVVCNFDKNCWHRQPVYTKNLYFFYIRINKHWTEKILEVCFFAIVLTVTVRMPVVLQSNGHT